MQILYYVAKRTFKMLCAMKPASNSLFKAIAGMLFCLLLTGTFSLTASAQSFSPGDDAKSVLEDKNVTVDYSTGLVHYSVPFSFFYSGEQTFSISFNYTSNTSHVGDNSGMQNWICYKEHCS